MEYEYLLRVFVAGVLGALIGLEREKRFKEAGIRTHFLVAIGSAIIMVISKYGFYDVLAEDIVLDPSRVAAQVVSGIGFLGAGMILVQRNSIHGLTTAAGIWATAGVGLAIGAGMYEIGIFTSLLIIIGLEFLRRLFQPVLPHIQKVSIQSINNDSMQDILQTLKVKNITVKDYQVKMKRINHIDHFEITLKLQSKKVFDKNELILSFEKIDGIKKITFK